MLMNSCSDPVTSCWSIAGAPAHEFPPAPTAAARSLRSILDPRSGRAWHLYRDFRGLSLCPSVWRDSGCKAHFILWRDRLIWCGRPGAGSHEPVYDEAIEARVLAAIDCRFRTAEEIAFSLNEVPWEISRTAERLVAKGAAELLRTDDHRMLRRASSAETEKGDTEVQVMPGTGSGR